MGGKVEYRLRDIVLCAATSQWGDVSPSPGVFGILRFGSLIFDRTRRDTIYADAEVTELGCGALGQHLNPPLARAIVG